MYTHRKEAKAMQTSCGNNHHNKNVQKQIGPTQGRKQAKKTNFPLVPHAVGDLSKNTDMVEQVSGDYKSKMRQKTERGIADPRETKNGAQYSKFRELLNRSSKEQKR